MVQRDLVHFAHDILPIAARVGKQEFKRQALPDTITHEGEEELDPTHEPGE